jgi:plastocyanin
LEHNVFFDNAPAGAPANITAPSANKNVTLTFPATGTYAYNCHIHPGMKGTITVK